MWDVAVLSHVARKANSVTIGRSRFVVKPACLPYRLSPKSNQLSQQTKWFPYRLPRNPNCEVRRHHKTG